MTSKRSKEKVKKVGRFQLSCGFEAKYATVEMEIKKDTWSRHLFHRKSFASYTFAFLQLCFFLKPSSILWTELQVCKVQIWNLFRSVLKSLKLTCFVKYRVLFMFRYLREMYALHSTADMWQIDLWAKYEEKDLSDLCWHDAVGWVLDCELCDLCGSWFPCAESINYPCLAPCPQLGHAGCGDLPQMRENRRHPNPRSDVPRPNHCHCRISKPTRPPLMDFWPGSLPRMIRWQ